MKKKIGVMIGALATFKAGSDILQGKELIERESALTDTVGEITIDTCIGFDTGVWETGINRGGKWHIVEQYRDDIAKIGHTKWLNAIKSNPNMDLPEINVWD